MALFRMELCPEYVVLRDDGWEVAAVCCLSEDIILVLALKIVRMNKVEPCVFSEVS